MFLFSVLHVHFTQEQRYIPVRSNIMSVRTARLSPQKRIAFTLQWQTHLGIHCIFTFYEISCSPKRLSPNILPRVRIYIYAIHCHLKLESSFSRFVFLSIIYIHVPDSILHFLQCDISTDTIVQRRIDCLYN